MMAQEPSAGFSALEGISLRLGQQMGDSLVSPQIPPVFRVLQRFARPRLTDVEEAVAREMARPEVRERIQPGTRVCVAVGSRGIANLADIVRAVVRKLQANGAEPFLIPAMGSHGGATPEGQLQVLADYGITPETMGAPIVSTLETELLGSVLGDVPVHFAVDALKADLIVPINRVKPHTSFRGQVESGLMKMLAIGMGKQRGAEAMHALGTHRFARLIPAAARHVLETQKVAFGIAIVENGYDETARIEALLPQQMEARERELLAEARSLMPSLPFDTADLLVIREIGKNISGSGMDPNVCGRHGRSGGIGGGTSVKQIAVLDLTPESHGNATGIGMAEFASLRVLHKMDFAATYANCLTAAHPTSAMLPVMLESDRMTIAAALRTVSGAEPGRAQLALIRNTLDVEEVWVSSPLLDQVRQRDYCAVEETPLQLEFDAEGNLIRPLRIGETTRALRSRPADRSACEPG